jgi:hypothetical protein
MKSSQFKKKMLYSKIAVSQLNIIKFSLKNTIVSYGEFI